MPINLGEAIKGAANSVFGSKLLGYSLGDSVWISVVITLIIFVIVIFTFSGLGKDFSCYIQLLFYTFLSTWLFVFIHDSVAESEYKQANEAVKNREFTGGSMNKDDISNVVFGGGMDKSDIFKDLTSDEVIMPPPSAPAQSTQSAQPANTQSAKQASQASQASQTKKLEIGSADDDVKSGARYGGMINYNMFNDSK